MAINQYRNLIIKVLQQSSGKKLTAEQVADALITRIGDAEEILADLGPAAIINPSPDITKNIPTDNNQLSPFANRSLETDIYKKLDAGPSVFEERYTIEQLMDFAKNEMPSILNVQPPGFEAPFAIRKFVEKAPGDMEYVRIVYQQEEGQMTTDAGQRIGPTLQLARTDQRLDADALTENIRLQANAMYSTVKPVLTPKRAPVLGSPGDLTKALGAEAGGGMFDPRGMSDAQVMAEAGRSAPAEWADRVTGNGPTDSAVWSGIRRRE